VALHVLIDFFLIGFDERLHEAAADDAQDQKTG
jgi:hypothetical protein